MYGSNGVNGPQYVLVTNTGCRMTSGEQYLYVSDTSIRASKAISVTSDRRMKKAIKYDMSRYEDFFMKLKPSSYMYKYKDATRTHTGFIAQDVESALTQSGLSSKDFAGITYMPRNEVTEKGINDICYGLRYEEFVSLNTYMIQNLYRRIERLEQELEKVGKGDKYER